ncbi:MAG TPA: O-antigen ligase family protein [Candidatus Limnocylindrales bacterium]|nr:O-antigen ligase family protein [Candidatus Limnocylindrales bacterium]
MEFVQQSRAYRPPATAMLIGMSALGLMALLMLNFPVLILGVVAVVGAISIVWAARLVQGNGAYLLCALLLIEELSGASFLPLTNDQFFMVRYPLLIAFCGAAAWTAFQNSEILQGGFLDYLIYLGFGVVSISYSLLPSYSTARILAAILMFMAIVKIARAVANREDIEKLLSWYLVGTGIVWTVILVSSVLMSHDVVWDVEEMTGLVRLRGIYGSPNQIGEIALATMGVGLVVWSRVSGWNRALLAAQMAAAFVLAGLADSRSPFVGLAVGGLLYLVWRYRLRAVPIIVALGVVGFILVAQLDPEYLNRGDVTSLTGRTDIWKFAIQKIEQRPLIGYGFEVEGEIMKAHDFPIWWGPWEDGPRSSLHSDYLSKAVSLGIPALVFWVFFFIRPWLALMRRKDDPWNLKPLFFLVVVPILLLDFTEGTAGDCRYAVGMIATLCWALAERQRLATIHRRPAAVPEHTVSPSTIPLLRRVA